jgi:hypothetical protein
VTVILRCSFDVHLVALQVRLVRASECRLSRRGRHGRHGRHELRRGAALCTLEDTVWTANETYEA